VSEKVFQILRTPLVHFFFGIRSFRNEATVILSTPNMRPIALFEVCSSRSFLIYFSCPESFTWEDFLPNGLPRMTPSERFLANCPAQLFSSPFTDRD
jgi:hypothetical protein